MRNQSVLAQQEEKLRALKLQCEQQDLKEQKNFAEQEALNGKLTADIEHLERSNKTLQDQLDAELQTADQLKIFVTKLFGEDENFS